MEGGVVGIINGCPCSKTAMFQPSPTTKVKRRYSASTRSTGVPLSSIISATAAPRKPPTKLSSSKPRTPRSGSRSAAREAALKDIQVSSDLCSALSRSGAILKVQDLNIILRNFGRSSRWDDLSQLFEWMQKHGTVNIASYSSFIKFMAESLDLSRALNAYQTINDEAMRNNSSICNSILNCLVKSNKFAKAINLFQQMKQSGLKPDVVTYSTLLAGCLKVEHGYTKALELVEELEDQGILMDSVTYGTLIAICASNCKSEEAEMYFMRMKGEGWLPNMFHYGSLLNAYSADGNYQKADMLVQDMKSAGLAPNKVVLTTLLKVYVRAGLFDKSKLLLSELEALGYAKDEMPYCLLMDGLSKSGKIGEAKFVFDQMNKRHVKSYGYSYSIMISACCRAEQLEEAKKLARDYEALYNKYDLVILNVMLCAYCRVGDMENVMRTLRKMDNLAIDPDQNTFHILIKYFLKEKMYLLAYRTLQDMHNKGHLLEEDILSSLLLHLGRVGAYSEAFLVYNISRTNEKTIDNTLHEKMLDILITWHLFEDAYVIIKDNAEVISGQAVERFLAAFMESGDSSLINDTLEAIHTLGHKISRECFHVAILRYVAQPEEKAQLLHLLQWMPSHGYLVDSSTRNLILNIWAPMHC